MPKFEENAQKRKIPRGLLAACAWLCVRFYQIAVSPLLHAFPGSGCRFYPTCSDYALDAIQKHGALKGCLMALFRILRCNPLCRGGIDPVPDKFSLRGLFRINAPPPRGGAD